MLRYLIYSFLATLIFAVPNLLLAQSEVSYSLRGLGANQLVFKFAHSNPAQLSVTPSSDGRSVRVSGVNLRFAGTSDISHLPLLSSIRQVKRGNFIDLIINLSDQAQFEVTKNAQDLSLWIKQQQTNPAKQSEDLKAAGTQTSETATTKLQLPKLSEQQYKTPLAVLLRNSAYMIELASRTLKGESLDGMTLAENSADSENKGQQEQVNSENDQTQLIADLTNELTLLRLELKEAQDKLALNSLPNSSPSSTQSIAPSKE